jgi:GrpB-like predicted nucleotidyltransferase (UPF0157 family)
LATADPNSMVVLSEYDPQWVQLYEMEAEPLRRVLGDVLSELHHIGSTSIPGMPAKPIIDMLGAVEGLDSVESKRGPLEAIGYHWMGEYGIPGRLYFVKHHSATAEDMVHLHLFDKSHPQVGNNLFFRDHLRENPEAARQYAELKRTLAEQFHNDRESYQDGKEPFIRSILERH